MTPSTITDVINFVIEHRLARTIPEGWRDDVMPERPSALSSPRQPVRAERTPENVAAYEAAKADYDARFQAWDAWHHVGGFFVHSWGDGEHRDGNWVAPNDLYEITARLLDVSETKAKRMVRDAAETGEVVRKGNGSTIRYTTAAIVDGEAKAAHDLDVEVRSLAAHAQSLGLKVSITHRVRGTKSLAVRVDPNNTVAELVEMLEAR